MNDPNPDLAQQALEQARQALRAKQAAEARTWAARAIRLNPRLDEAWLILAAFSGPAESVECIKRALAINPENPRARQGMHWAVQRLREESSQPSAASGHPSVVSRQSSAISDQRSEDGNQLAAASDGFLMEGGKPLPEPPEYTAATRRVISSAATRATQPVTVRRVGVGASTPPLVSAPAKPRPSTGRLPAARRGRIPAGVFWATGLGALLLLCVILLIGPATAVVLAANSSNARPVSALSKPSLTPTNTSTFTPTATATAAPTSTPTATSLPTGTLTITPAPTHTHPPPPTDPPAPTWTPIPVQQDWPPAQEPAEPPQNATEGHWVDVNLSAQTAAAYDGNELVRSFVVSTGTSAHPTVTGQFSVYVKYRYADMAGPGYYLPDVPYVMYFYKGYGLHGTYWHSNFGTPMSHGCVNFSIDDAAWLYDFVSVGTLVNVHY